MIFDELKQNMNELMIPLIIQNEIFDIIYSILCLSNIEFINKKHGYITMNKESLPFAKTICNLLNIQPTVYKGQRH